MIWLLLESNKLYIGSPTALLDLTLSLVEKLNSNVTQIKKAYIW